MSEPDASLGVRTKVAYGIGATAESAIGMAFNSFNFLFYNNVLGLSGTLCGLAVNQAIVFTTVNMAGWSYRVALAIVLLVVPVLTYLVNRQWVFRAPPVV